MDIVTQKRPNISMKHAQKHPNISMKHTQKHQNIWFFCSSTSGRELSSRFLRTSAAWHEPIVKLIIWPTIFLRRTWRHSSYLTDQGLSRARTCRVRGTRCRSSMCSFLIMWRKVDHPLRFALWMGMQHENKTHGDRAVMDKIIDTDLPAQYISHSESTSQ